MIYGTLSLEIPREFRGVWVATVDNIDWPSKRTLDTASQKKELLDILDRAAEINLNAVVFQVRPSADALYKSDLEPWSEYLTNAQGVPPNPEWDPLAFAVEEAHRRGLELHAWFNPYRAWHPAAKGKPAKNFLGQTHPNVVKQYGTYQWMDPSDPIVQKRSKDVFLDVVRRYDVDGIHIDDYFYPYPITDADKKKVDFPDEENWQKYLASGGTLTRNDWRRSQVDKFIEDVYIETKKVKKWVKFGISPFGIYRPGHPPQIAGFDQYEELYADALKWYREGWCDYWTPQLYWPIAQEKQSYPVLLQWWAEQNSAGRHLWVGNYTGRLQNQWEPQEVLDQIKITREKAGGNVHFSMKSFSQDFKGINKILSDGPYKQKAVIPASPWLSPRIPATPKVTRVNGNTLKVGRAPADARFWVVIGYNGGTYSVLRLFPANMQELSMPDWNPARSDVRIEGVALQDKYGQLSEIGRPANP